MDGGAKSKNPDGKKSAAEETIPLADRVIMWLGQWRDALPGQAVDDLQEICRGEKSE